MTLTCRCRYMIRKWIETGKIIAIGITNDVKNYEKFSSDTKCPNHIAGP